MLYPTHLRKIVIRPALQIAGSWSESAENLIMGVAAVESDMGTYLTQRNIDHGKGGLGIYQMERKTHNDLWSRMHTGDRDTILSLCNMAMGADADRMCWDLRYATLMCRYHFKKFPEKLPPAHDIIALGKYWKDYYNTSRGKGTVDDYVEKYHIYVERYKNEDK